jgi:hypothetical protein
MTWHPLLDQLRARCYSPDLLGLVDEKRDQGRNQEIAIGKQSQSVRLDRAHGRKDAQDAKLNHVVLQRRPSVGACGKLYQDLQLTIVSLASGCLVLR